MKKLMTFLLAGLLISIATVTYANPLPQVQAYINDGFRFIFNGEQKQIPQDSNVLLHQNRVYLPLRFIGESLGADIVYEESTKSIFINSQTTSNVDEIESIRKDYEDKISSLNSEIASLKSEIENLSQVKFEKLPQKISTEEYTLTIEGFTRDYNRLFVRMESNNSNNLMRVSPLETRISSGSTHFEPIMGITDFNLYNSVSRNETVRGYIDFESIPNDVKNITIKMTVIENDRVRETPRTFTFDVEL